MAISRAGRGARPAARALASQVHPVFMLPPLAASWFGAIVVGFGGGSTAVTAAAVHMLAMFFAVYTAHVKDGYVDYYVRDEDDSHPLTPRGCLLGLVVATAGFVACLGYLWLAVDAVAAVLTLPTWFLGFLHAPYLDTNPVTATAGYPTGVAMAIVGGGYVQARALPADVIAFAAVFLVVLCGIKIIDDAQDYRYDRSIGKRTAVVALGPDRAVEAAYGLLVAGLVLLLWVTFGGYVPPFSLFAALALAAVVAVTLYAGATLSTMLLIRGTYVFFALLIVAVWYRPLSGAPLPDVGVFGPYTYLVTEVVFGSAAFLLLYRAGTDALARTARTVVALYPIAYLWDWYALEAGVFAIELRTGFDLFGIPLEEHVFMLVVPAVVLAVHETVHAVFPFEAAGEIKTGVPADDGPGPGTGPTTSRD